MSKKIILILILFLLANLLFSKKVVAQISLAQKLSGRILLQVQSHGQAWYVNPLDLKKYYLGSPADALKIMRSLSLGITNQDLAKVPTTADKPNEQNLNFINKHLGKLFLQVQSKGECWYLNPVDKKRYFLARPEDALKIMRQFGLGITNDNLNNIITGYLIKPSASTPCQNCPTTPATNQIIAAAANAIRSDSNTQALSYFTSQVQSAVNYTLNFLNSEGKLILANILADAELTTDASTEKIYTSYVYFNGDKIKVDFHLQKQTSGQWLLANL